MHTKADTSIGRWRPLTAVLWGALLFAACETVLSLGLRWNHAPGYFLTCALLTLLPAAVVGSAGALLRFSVPRVILAWIFVAGLLVYGIVAALLLALAAVPPLRSPLGPRTARGWCLGSCAAFALVLAFPRGEGFAHVTGLTGILGPTTGEALGLAVLFAAIYQTVPRLLARFPRRELRWGGEPMLALVVAAAALALSAKPFVTRSPEGRRLPRESERTAAVEVDRLTRPHVFLLVLDTLRADHLSVYGYERETTPSLARLLAERPNGTVFPQAYANGTWTVPSHASLLTGLAPHEHGVHFALDGSVRFGFGLAEDTTTLAAVLRGQGYKTLGTFANNWLRIIRGLDGGFDRYFRAHHSEPLPFVGERLRELLVPGIHPEARKAGARAPDVVDALLSMTGPWAKTGAPLFVFANFGDTHGPYLPMPGFRGRFAPPSWRESIEHVSIHDPAARRTLLEARYDEEILYLDHHLGLLLDELARRGLLDDSWVFLTSDHGEAFGEHGVTEHGTGVYDEIVRVPLIVFPPTGQTISPARGPVSLVDVAATIAALAGASLDGPGRDLRAEAGPDSTVSIEFYGDRSKASRHGDSAAVPAVSFLRGTMKLIRRGEDHYELYDLAADPGETTDLAAARPAVVEELRAHLPIFGVPTPLDPGLSGDAAERARIERQLADQGYFGHQD